MTAEHKKILEQINAYTEKALADIDPQKTPVFYQLERLRPVMERTTTKTEKTIEDIFIHYMDLASEAGTKAKARFQKAVNEGSYPEADIPISSQNSP